MLALKGLAEYQKKPSLPGCQLHGSGPGGVACQISGFLEIRQASGGPLQTAIQTGAETRGSAVKRLTGWSPSDSCGLCLMRISTRPQAAWLAVGAAAARTTVLVEDAGRVRLPRLALVQVADVFPGLAAISPDVVLNEPGKVGRQGRIELPAVNPAGEVLYWRRGGYWTGMSPYQIYEIRRYFI